MSEINVYANRVAAAKEQIRQALSARGLTISASVGLSAYADLITNAFFPGTGDSVSVTNMTGSSIAVGDKVFIKENVAVEADRTVVDSTQTFYILSPDGETVWYYNKLYDVENETTSASSEYSTTPFLYNSGYIKYDANGNMYIYSYKFNQDINEIYSQDNYTVNTTRPTSTSVTLTKCDSSLTPVQSWEITSLGSGNIYEYIHCVIGDKYYYSNRVGSYGYNYVAEIDDNETTIAATQRSDKVIVLHSTIDNSLALVADKVNENNQGNMSYCYISGFKLYKLNANYELEGLYISSNKDLCELLYESYLYVSFNRYTGTLCISTRDNTGKYGLFKYNTTTHDFDTIPLVLPDNVAAQYQMMTVSNDLTKLQIGNQLYTLEQTAGGYKAIPYSRGIGSDVLTGFATSAAAHGSNFTVETVAEAS